MSAAWVETLGLVAGACTTVAFVPQVMQVWKSRSAKDISLGMYLIFVTGVALWLVYGIYAEALPVIVANALTLVLAGAVLAMKLTFDRKR
ncbi:SemiSWEET transporter [Chitinibacteraceae bacterium HSL-7]